MTWDHFKRMFWQISDRIMYIMIVTVLVLGKVQTHYLLFFFFCKCCHVCQNFISQNYVAVAKLAAGGVFSAIYSMLL